MYRPGKEMLLADAFSRLPSWANNSEIKLNLWVNAISFSAFRNSRLTTTANETQRPNPVDCAPIDNQWMANIMETHSQDSSQLLGLQRWTLNWRCSFNERWSYIMQRFYFSWPPQKPWRCKPIPVTSKDLHVLARNGGRCHRLCQMVHYMHQQFQDASGNVTSTWGPQLDHGWNLVWISFKMTQGTNF